MQYDWKPEYAALAREFIKRHFGGTQGLAWCFPCMRDTYPWGSHRPDVVDARVPAKNATEYHGLERHAKQYHVTAQYEFAYHYWLIAAYWRRGDLKANNYGDEGHHKAIGYALKQSLYNRALSAWQEDPKRGRLPMPEQFDIDPYDIDKQDKKALGELESYMQRIRGTVQREK